MLKQDLISARGTEGGRPTEAERGASSRSEVSPTQPITPRQSAVSGWCPTISTYRFSDTGVNYTVPFCIQQVHFNSGPGNVAINTEAEIRELAAERAERRTGDPILTQRWLTFRNNAGRNPAWEFEVNVPQLPDAERARREQRRARGERIPYVPDGIEVEGTGARPSQEQQMGFIQTVQLLRWTAEYEGIPSGRFVINIENKRDALPNVPAPWHSNPFGFRNPQTPSIADAPSANFRVWARFSRSSRLREHPLRSVRVQGIFRIWLIIKNPSAPLDESHIQLLYHITIALNRTWTHTFYQGVEGEPQQFTPSGVQHIITHGAGRGPAATRDGAPIRPILTGSSANEELRTQVAALPYLDR